MVDYSPRFPSSHVLHNLLQVVSVTMNQRIGVEPVLLALGNLSKNARYLYQNVRPIGYIPNNYVKSTAEKTAESQRKAGKGRSCRNYHACLKQILSKVSDAQKYYQTNKTMVRFGEHVKNVYIYMPLAYFVGDAKSQDMLACRYSSY